MKRRVSRTSRANAFRTTSCAGAWLVAVSERGERHFSGGKRFGRLDELQRRGFPGSTMARPISFLCGMAFPRFVLPEAFASPGEGIDDTPNQAVELTSSARHADCYARGLALAPVAPRGGG